MPGMPNGQGLPAGQGQGQGQVDFSSLFGVPAFPSPAVPAPAAVDPSVLYATQLTQLQDMGFTDNARNIQVRTNNM